MEEILKNIYRIPVPLPDNPLKELNSYLIFDEHRSLLIDTGFRHPISKEALLKGFAEIGVDVGSVDVFLTHMHADHTGLVSEFIGKNRKIYMSEVDGELMKKLPSPGDEWADDKWVWSKSRDELSGMPKEITEHMVELNPALKYAPLGGLEYTCLKDGDTLEAGGYEMRCILTPGHSPGHMCLWDERHSVMFTGDHVLFDITPNITAWPDVADSLGDYITSLHAVKGMPVKTALPGHRKPGDFHARIEAILQHHDKRLKEVEAIVSENPGLTAYEIAGIMRWKIRATDWNDFPASQKIFAVGECMAHLNYLHLRGRVKRELDETVYRFFYQGTIGEKP